MLSEFWRRVTMMFRRERLDRELSEEMRLHREMRERELREREMREGAVPNDGVKANEARYAARRRFGNELRLREESREMWGWKWLEDFAQDIRYGARTLRMKPGFAAVAVLTLGLGIGANTAIFTLIDTVMLRMLPVRNPQELVTLAVRHPHANGELDSGFSNPLWQKVRDTQDVFSGIFASSTMSFDLAQGGEKHNIHGLYVSGDFFKTLGVQPAAGRVIASGDDVRGCTGAAVLSYGFWQEHYGDSQSAVGSTISLNRHPFQIIGVGAPGFFGVTVGQTFDVAVPVCAEAIISIPGEPDGQKFLDRPSAQWLNVMARTKPGISLEKVNARLQALSPEIFAATVSTEWKPEWQKDFLASALIAKSAAGGISDVSEYEQPLKMLMAVVGLVLIIACANIASLMLARATGRRKEIAVRMALGASRSRLIRQLLTECMVLSFLGAMLGVLFAWWGSALLVRLISTSQFHVFLQFSLDSRILGFTAGIAILTGLLFGILPVLRATRISLTSAMKGGASDEATERSHFRPGRWTVATQIAFSLVLLVVAGLFLRTFNNLMRLDTGFDRTNVLLVETDDHSVKVSREQRSLLYRQILNRLNTLPGATSASESFVTPIGGNEWGLDFYLENGGGPKGDDANSYMNFVSPGFFATLHSPLIAGRDFDDHDGTGAPPVVILNETMARKFFPRSDPVGQYIVTDDFLNNHLERLGPPMRIVGVAKDSIYMGLRENRASIVYIPIAQAESLNDPRIFEIRTAAPPMSLARSAEQAITGPNRSLSLHFHTLESQVDESLRPEHLLAILSGFFAGLALLLAMIGLYGTLAYMVAQRRKEIGIRIALGAGKESIIRLVMRDVSLILITGVAGGLVISYWATRLTQKMLFNLDTHDAKTMLVAVTVLTLVALFAGYLPARRASKLDPMAVLRNE
jgi:putative ABC transport system permease protein